MQTSVTEADLTVLGTHAGDDRVDPDLATVGDQPTGTWLLTFLDTAREVITEEAAAQIGDAIRAVNLVMQGETNVDHLFADLIDREPPRPPSMPKSEH